MGAMITRMGAMITRMYTDLGTKRAYAMLTYEHMLPATSFVYMCSLSIGLARCFFPMYRQRLKW